MSMIAKFCISVFLWLLGAGVFSFLKVIIYRVSRRMPFASGHSRYCGSPVSSRYPWVEFFGGCMALLCVFKIGCNLAAITVFAFLGMLTVVALVDIDTMQIPNGFVLTILLLGLISLVTMPGLSLLERAAGMACASLPLLIITVLVPGAFGGGDIKLMFASGLFLGWKISLLALFLSVLTGGLYGSYLLITGKKKGKDHFAFAPFLCGGMFLALFWGDELINWYLQICGLR